MNDDLINKLSRKAQWLHGTPALNEASDLMYQSIEEIQKWRSIADDLYDYFVAGTGISTCVQKYLAEKKEHDFYNRQNSTHLPSVQ